MVCVENCCCLNLETSAKILSYVRIVIGVFAAIYFIVCIAFSKDVRTTYYMPIYLNCGKYISHVRKNVCKN